MPMTLDEKLTALQAARDWNNAATNLLQAAAAPDVTPPMLSSVMSNLPEAQALIDEAKAAAPAAADAVVMAKADECIARGIAVLQAALAP